MPLVLLVAGCTDLLGDFDRVIALEIVGMTVLQVEEGDTGRFSARALDAAGNVVAGAEISWAVIDTGTVGFTIDGASGLVTGLTPGSGRVQARIDELRSDPLSVSITPAADTIAPAGARQVLFPASDPQSPGLTTVVEDLTSTPGQVLALADKRVVYDLVTPSPGTPAAGLFFLTVSDTTPAAEPHHLESVTAPDGRVSAFVRRSGANHPADSAVIHAVALTARGDTVAGSPVRFVVVF